MCQPFHGGQFAVNDCRKLLKNVDTLQRLAKENCATAIFGIIDTLRKFNAVVKDCFSNTLGPKYDVKIDQFKNSYLSLTKGHTKGSCCFLPHQRLCPNQKSSTRNAQ